MRGTHLDPEIVDCFEASRANVLAIKKELQDINLRTGSEKAS